MRKVLVVDDESSIRRLLRVSLEANDYQIIEAKTAQEGIQKIIEERPEIILLDLGLPDKNGLTVIKEVRQWSTTPIIVLTVIDRDQDKVDALDSGADDYITKPFSIPELLVRMRVALRHNTSNEQSSIIKCGLLEMDLAGHVLKINNQLIKLTATEFDILKVLVRYKGKVVTHRVLLNEVWGPNSVEHVHYLRVYLGNLRKKLKIEGSDQELIATEAGVGYRLVDDD
ncbi:MAG: response regulator [Bacteriovorax sp.]|nr:response regulator [Bacteriovorax sp.]